MTDPRPGTLSAPAPGVDDDNPWPGLLAFNENFRKFFFGRSIELDDLFRRVRREILTVLYAQSGLGKTSLLQAGLFPRLREEGFLPVPIRLEYGGTTPETQAAVEPPHRQILHAIAGAIRDRGLREASDPGACTGPWEYLHQVELALPDETGSPLTPVLVFDQFEELFTLGAGRRDGGRFADGVVQILGDLIENRPPHALEKAIAQDPTLVDRYDFTRGNYRVLLSLREDYLPHLHGLRREMPSIILNNVRLSRFNRRQALEVVERPAASRGLVTRPVAEAIVRTVAGLDATAEAAGTVRPGEHSAPDTSSKERLGERMEVDPALLSLFCRELNGLRIEGGERVISLELVAGSKESVLHDFYLNCFQDLSPPPEPGVKAFVEDYLLTSKGYRDRLTLERATEILVSDYHGRAEELDQLVSRRLLQVEERGKTPQIELSHDVLAPIAMRQRVERVRNEALRLEEERRQEELRRATQEEREAKAREAAAAAALATAERQQRRTLALLGVVAIAAVIAVYSAISARTAKRDADAARTVAVRAESTAVRERDRAVAATQDAERAGAAALRAESTAVEERDAQARLAREARAARDTTAQTLAMVSLERAKSDSLVADFCTYTTDLVRTLGDSLETNQDLKASYGALLEKSDTAVDKMSRRDVAGACTQQLSARIRTAATQVRRTLDARTKFGVEQVEAARTQGFRALQAVRALARRNDTLSRQVAVQSYYDLTYEFFVIARRDTTVRDTVIRAAREGALLAAQIDPARDSSAFDRIARLHHYAAIALTQRGRFDSARIVIDDGLNAIARGHRRQERDQDEDDLLFTESQLWMRRGELDSAMKRPGPALQQFDSAVVIARKRLLRFQLSRNRRWLAVAQQSRGDMAMALKLPAEAIPAYDSSAANWSLYARRMRDANVHDTTAAIDALQTLSNVRIAEAGAALQLGRVPEALGYAHDATDSASVAASLWNTRSNRRALTRTFADAMGVFEEGLPRARADSVYDAWFRRDSTRAALDLAAAPGSVRPSARGFDQAVDQIITLLEQRLRADTAGKTRAESARQRSVSELATLRYREAQIWIHRVILARTNSDGARDSLGLALGNISWTYLLIGRPKEAAETATEGLRLAPAQTFIIPNLFNAVLLRGPEEEARVWFTRYAGQDVEDPKIRFECAVERDLRLLRDAGVATEQHLETLQRFLGAQAVSCTRPSDTP